MKLPRDVDGDQLVRALTIPSGDFLEVCRSARFASMPFGGVAIAICLNSTSLFAQPHEVIATVTEEVDKLTTSVINWEQTLAATVKFYETASPEDAGTFVFSVICDTGAESVRVKGALYKRFNSSEYNLLIPAPDIDADRTAKLTVIVQPRSKKAAN